MKLLYFPGCGRLEARASDERAGVGEGSGGDVVRVYPLWMLPASAQLEIHAAINEPIGIK